MAGSTFLNNGFFDNFSSAGGIYNYGTLNVTNSTNRSFGDGGGIANSGTLTVTNSAFYGNGTFEGSGGGITWAECRDYSITGAFSAKATPG